MNPPDLGRLYTGYASVVCGLLLVNLALATQGMSSGAQSLSGLVAALLQPVPMFLLARAKRDGHGWFRWAAIAWPVVLAIYMVAGPGGYPREGSEADKLIHYVATAQLLNLPGAAIFGSIVGITSLRLPKHRTKSKDR